MTLRPVVVFRLFDLSCEGPKDCAGLCLSVMFELACLDEEGQLEFAFGGGKAVRGDGGPEQIEQVLDVFCWYGKIPEGSSRDPRGRGVLRLTRSGQVSGFRGVGRRPSGCPQHPWRLAPVPGACSGCFRVGMDAGGSGGAGTPPGKAAVVLAAAGPPASGPGLRDAPSGFPCCPPFRPPCRQPCRGSCAQEVCAMLLTGFVFLPRVWALSGAVAVLLRSRCGVGRWRLTRAARWR